MNEEFNKNDMNEEFKKDEQAENKWEPDTEKYNSVAKEDKPAAPKKKKSLWWIPVVAVTVAVVLGISAFAAVGLTAIKKAANGDSFIGKAIESIQYEVGIDDIDDIKEKIVEEIVNDPAAEETEEESVFIIGDTENALKPAQQGSIYLTDVSDVVKKVMPSVVAITSRQMVSSGGYNNFFGFYYGYQGNGETKEVEAGTGSGTIVGQNEKEILVLTSYHVVEGCSSLYVTLNDGSAIEGYVKSTSEDDDIAIVAMKIADVGRESLENITMATLSKDPVDVGDGAIVIGNALGYGQSVVTGIISAIDREINVENRRITVIQTDAAINQGNSGGCLLNANGEIVGISEAKINSSIVEGMCYAISINHYYDKIISMLKEPALNDEAVDEEESQPQGQGAFLGIQGYDVTSQVAQSYGIPMGVYVVEATKGGGAAAAGIVQGDVIIGIKGTTITSMDELKAQLAKCNPGDKVKVKLVRYENSGYVEKEVEVILSAQMG